MPAFDHDKQIINQKRLLSKSVLDSLRSNDRDELSQNVKINPDTLLDYEDDEGNDSDEDDVGTIHPYGPGIDPKKLLHALTGEEYNSNGDHVMSFTNNAPFPTTIARNTNLNIDKQGTGMAPLPGAPREVQAQIVKPRFVTLNWQEPYKNPDQVISYSVYYKLSTSDR